MKKTFKFNKLIRDKMYDIMVDKGIEVNCISTDNKEYQLKYFKEKFIEEAKEIVNATSKDSIIEELADMLEIVFGFCKFLNIDKSELLEAKEKKLKQKGAYNNFVVVDTVSLDEDHEFMDYYLSSPEKYPEVM